METADKSDLASGTTSMEETTMGKYSNRLPQLGSNLFLTDGGMETSLIFHDGLELPHFASFPLLKTAEGREALRKYYNAYIAIAKAEGLGFILESPTWRATTEWGTKLGYSATDIAAINRDSIAFMQEFRDTHETPATPIVVSGNVGPRGDGYDPGRIMTVAEAEDYHAHQIGTFAEAGADMTTAMTLTNTNEAVGVVRAAQRASLPVAISFTVETDGRLPTGETLESAINAVDFATAHGAVYFMINCAHPTHFESVLPRSASWTKRLRGLRANASMRSHQELNDSPDLDMGDPILLGAQYRELLRRHPQLTILGGCCGTDHRHVQSISHACRNGELGHRHAALG